MTFQRQLSNDDFLRKARSPSNYCSKVARSHHPSPIVSHSLSNRCQKPPGGIASSLSITSASSSTSRASWSAASPFSSNSRTCSSLSASSSSAVNANVSADSGTPRRQGGGWAFDKAGAPGRRALRERRVSALDDAWSPERQGGHLRDAGVLRDGGLGL